MTSTAIQPAVKTTNRSCIRSMRCLILLTSCIVAAGCASMMPSADNWLEKQPEFVTPSKVIPVWSDTVLHQAGQAGTRGCGGRIMFYAGDGKRAVRVDGSLVVYAWDDSKPQKDRQPDRKFVFPMKDLQNHYSGSTIGDSYSFWLPWDAAGGERTELTLVVRFVGRNGSEVTSTPAKAILPGIVPLPEQRTAKQESSSTQDASTQNSPVQSASGIQRVAFRSTHDLAAQADQPPETPSPSRVTNIRTTEIALTDGFLRRNMQGTAPVAAFSAEDLFSSATTDQRDSAERAASDLSSSSRFTESQSEHLADQDAQPTAPLAGRSLRFRDRVRSSREAQRSVGHALSERYQSAPRLAPWQKD